MTEILKLRVDRKILSSLKRKKNMSAYVETLLQQDAYRNKFQQLISKLTAGYNLGRFNRADVYDRH